MVGSVHNIQFDKILICISVIAWAGVKFGKLSRVVVTQRVEFNPKFHARQCYHKSDFQIHFQAEFL